MLGALSLFTSYDKIVHFGKELSARDLVKESYAIAARVIANASETLKSPEVLFYLTSKAVFRLYSKPMGQASLPGVPVEPIVLSSQDIITLSYGFIGNSPDQEKGYKLFERAGIVKSSGSRSGSKSSKQKEYILLEPLSTTIDELKRVLGMRGINPLKLAAEGRKMNAVDILHLLEYYAKQGSSAFRAVYQSLYNMHQELVKEAVEAARVISGYAWDPEAGLSKLVIEYIEGR
jgi:adenine-specific DNA methylase